MLFNIIWAKENKNEIKSEKKDFNSKKNNTSDPLLLTESEKIEVENEIQNFLKDETGVERIKQMYKNESSPEMSSELLFCVQTMFNAGLITFLFSASYGAHNASERFIEKNKHTAFKTKFLAMRSYRDAMLLGAMKFGMKMSFKVAVFTGLFLFTSQTIAVYRNKTSVLEYVSGGAVSGGLLKMNRGLKGLTSGTIIGSTMG